MGRPRGFDEQEVLKAASEAFWARGYEGTSTRDLVKVTGLTQPSLYNAFGDKRSLFRKAFNQYMDTTVRERVGRLERLPSAALAISSFFAEIVDRSASDPEQRGCLLVNSAIETTAEDPEFRQAVAQELAQTEAFFARRAEAAQRSGEMPATVAPGVLGTHLLTLMLGVRVLARIHRDRETLARAVSPTLMLLGLPPLPAETARS
jgi:TetR/AcrR family transcriptional repressor of nem operon